MKVTFRAWRTDRDTDKEGNSNLLFKYLIEATLRRINSYKVNYRTKDYKNIPQDKYVSYDINDEAFYDIIENEDISSRLNIDKLQYWETIKNVALACKKAQLLDNDNYSDLWEIPVYIDAPISFLNENVFIEYTHSSGLPINGVFSNTDEEGNVLKWKDWYNSELVNDNGITEYTNNEGEDRAILFLNKNTSNGFNTYIPDLDTLITIIDKSEEFNYNLLTDKQYSELISEVFN